MPHLYIKRLTGSTPKKSKNMKYSIFRIIVVLFCLLQITNDSQAQTKTDSLKTFFDKLNAMFETSDIKIILEDLNPNFSASISSYPASELYLQKIIESKKIESVKFNSVQTTGADTILVDVSFVNTDGTKVKGVVAFDKNNKLLFVDYFDRFFIGSGSRYDKSKKKAEIPFYRKDGSIMLPIKLNNSTKILHFILDTGANGMAIRKSLGDSLNLEITHTNNVSVVGGGMQVPVSRGNTVCFSDSFSLQNQNIALFEGLGTRMDGIIGLNLAKEYILNLDFDKQILSLFSFGEYAFDKDGETLDITLPSGIVMVPATLNIVGKKEVSGSFVFDTGAHYHAIGFEAFVRKNRLLLSGFKSENQGTTQSLGIVTPVFNGKCYSFRFGKNIKLQNIPITLQASSGRKIADDEPDGSIGIDLLGQFNITIDLLRKLIHLSPNSKMQKE